MRLSDWLCVQGPEGTVNQVLMRQWRAQYSSDTKQTLIPWPESAELFETQLQSFEQYLYVDRQAFDSAVDVMSSGGVKMYAQIRLDDHTEGSNSHLSSSNESKILYTTV